MIKQILVQLERASTVPNLRGARGLMSLHLISRKRMECIIASDVGLKAAGLILKIYFMANSMGNH